MKRIFTLIAATMCLILPMQAHFSTITNITNNNIERQVVRKARTSAITVDDIVGTYDAHATTLLQGNSDPEWSVTITADENETDKVWIHPICLFNKVTAKEIYPIYATLNNDGTLSMPLGQTIFEDQGYQFVIGASEDGKNVDTSSNVTMTVIVDNRSTTITYAEKLCFGVGNILRNEWWYQAMTKVSLTKEAKTPNVYIYNKDKERPTRIKAWELYFLESDGEMLVSTSPEYSNGIEGTYTVNAKSAVGYGDEEWSVTITRDEIDPNIIWIQPILLIPGFNPEDIKPVYATYDEESGFITMPLGQVVYKYRDEYKVVVGASEDGKKVDTESDFWMLFENNTITFEEDLILGLGNTIGNLWWYQAVYEVVFSKNTAQIFPISEIERITRKEPEILQDYTFFKPGNYTWEYGIPISGSELEMHTSATSFASGEQFELVELFKDADDEIATKWTITGLLDELGYFTEDSKGHETKAITYTTTYGGETIEILTLIDPENENNNYSSIGKTITKDDFGNSIIVELYLGDFTGSSFEHPSFAAFSEDEIVFAGTQLVLYYIYEGYAYIIAHIYQSSIFPTDNNVAPTSTKVAFETNSPIVGQKIAITPCKGDGYKKEIFTR